MYARKLSREPWAPGKLGCLYEYGYAWCTIARSLANGRMVAALWFNQLDWREVLYY